MSMAESNNSDKNRVTCKRPHPNPLFKEWLESLYHDAVKDKSSLAIPLKEALTSISKYPLPLKSGAECAILKGFDKGLCHYLDMHLNELREFDKRARVTEAQRRADGKEIVKDNMGSKENIIVTGKVNMVSDKDKEAHSSQSSGAQAFSIEHKTSKPVQPERNLPSGSRIKTRFHKRVKKTIVINSDFLPPTPGESNDKTNTNRYEIKSDANSNTITINHNTNISLENMKHPYTYTIDKDGAICMQCDLSAGTKKKVPVIPRKYYKPAYRTGGYAILVALIEQYRECSYRESLTKEELIAKAQKHCDVSFTEPKPQTDYTAWIYAKRLINKGLLRVIRCPTVNDDVYLLTDLGRFVGEKLVKEREPEVTVNDILYHGQPHDRVPSLNEDFVLVPPPPAAFDELASCCSLFLEMPSTTFEIVLLIDKHETAFMDKKNDPMSALFARFNCFKHEYRNLKIGDFGWVARSRQTGQELVIPYVVERKRMDDFSASIKDGRFHEQKFRLRKSGLKNVIYLIENCVRNKQSGLPYSTLVQAMVNTSVQDGFLVHRTESIYHSVQFIGLLTKRLIHKLQYAFLRGCNKHTNGKELVTFDYFTQTTAKNKPLTVREMFIKMLLQLKGLSVEKALAITNKYSTPKALMKAYDFCTEKEGELLLANLKYNQFTRNVGPAVSKTIYMLFTKIEL